MPKTGKGNKENSNKSSRKSNRLKVEQHYNVDDLQEELLRAEELAIIARPIKKRKSQVHFSDDLDISKNSNSHDVKEDELDSDMLDDSFTAKDGIKNDAMEANEVAPNWPETDLKELIQRMEEALPEEDLLSFSTRVGRINWDEICFGEYSGEECKNTWMYIQKRIRRFRLLGELLQDAKQWITKPWTNFYGGTKTIKHPDMPKKPPSVYLRFYLKKKDKVYRDNPGIDMPKVSTIIAQMYKSLSPSKREKYLQQEAAEKKEYLEKLKEFYQFHPDFPKSGGEKSNRVPIPPNMCPKKPQTPFNLYYEDQLKQKGENDHMPRDVFKMHCKDQWRSMPDNKKVVWINIALDKEEIFKNELKDYVSNNPSYNPGTRKPVLTKEEKLLRERVAGKPIKPPTSAYSLFSSEVLKGEEIKKVDARERLKEVATQWKNCPDTKKEYYRQEVNRLMEEYKSNFAHYLATLSEEQRQEELQNHLNKRKAPVKVADEQLAKKKKKTTIEVEKKIERISPPPPPSPIVVKEKYADEPVQPPVSSFLLFSQKYSGKKTSEEAWKHLTKREKFKLEDDLEKMKHQYLEAYVKFLKGMSKEELKEYKAWKHERESASINNTSVKEEASDEDSYPDSESETASNLNGGTNDFEDD